MAGFPIDGHNLQKCFFIWCRSMRRESKIAAKPIQGEKKAEKKHVPLAVGVLIFDEVKAILKLVWNVKK